VEDATVTGGLLKLAVSPPDGATATLLDWTAGSI